jgi:hypothetical protein
VPLVAVLQARALWWQQHRATSQVRIIAERE